MWDKQGADENPQTMDIVSRAYRVHKVQLRSCKAVCPGESFRELSCLVGDFIDNCRIFDVFAAKQFEASNALINAMQNDARNYLRSTDRGWLQLHDDIDYSDVEKPGHLVHWNYALFVPHSVAVLKNVVKQQFGDDYYKENDGKFVVEETEDEGADEEEQSDEEDLKEPAKVQVFRDGATPSLDKWTAVAASWTAMCPVQVHAGPVTVERVVFSHGNEEHCKLVFTVRKPVGVSTITSELFDQRHGAVVDLVQGDWTFFHLSDFLRRILPVRNKASKRMHSAIALDD
jgi:hypothetical protein